MELLQLRYFRTIAKFESITKAADYFHIPQPAMSQSLARLEKELGGVRLFDRKKGRLFLNDKGRSFLSSVERALDELDSGILEITNDQNKIAGPLRIVATENRRFVFDCAASFRSRYPEVNLSISHSYDLDQPCDLCISTSPFYGRMKAAVPLIREAYVAVVHENHPLASHHSLSLEELRSEKFITLGPKSSQHAVTVEQCRLHGFEPDITFICDDEYYVRKYVSEQMGIALAPSVSWAGRFRVNTKTIPLTDGPIVSSYLIWDDSGYQSPAVKSFRSYLLQQAAVIPDNLCQPD